jgi:hypothetical protein
MIAAVGVVSKQPSVVLGQVIDWKPWPSQTERKERKFWRIEAKITVEREKPDHQCKTANASFDSSHR